MPQLDIDLFEDFIFFAFVSLLMFGDEDSEESVIAMATDVTLANYYLEVKKVLLEESNFVKLFFTKLITTK
jgi:hypothetical protein